MSRVAAAVAVLLLAGAARADVLHVPADFPTIQAAIDATQEGDEVVVAAGTYAETLLLQAKTDVTLRGQGQVILLGDARAVPVIDVSMCSGVTIERLRIEPPAAIGIIVGDSELVRISHCRVEQPVSDGIFLNGAPATVIERCQVLEPGGSGMHVVGSDGVLVSRCRVEGSQAAAVVLSGSNAARVERCTFVQPQTFGIVIGFPASSSGCTALRNVILEPGLLGVDVLGPFTTVSRNRIVGAGGDGVLVESGAVGAIIEDNDILHGEQSAVDVQSSQAFVRHNRLVKPAGSGIVVLDDSPSLSDNLVLHAGGSGLVLAGAVSGGAVDGNRVLHAGGNGVEASGTGLVYEDNLVLGAADDGFVVDGASNVVLANTAKGSGSFDLESLDGTNTYVDNIFPVVNHL